jgi:hypothetical protein
MKSHKSFGHSCCWGGVISLLGLLSLVATSRAQGPCPDASWPDVGPIWDGPHSIYILIPGTNCHETIYYCDRNNTTAGEWEQYIEAVVPNPLDTCKDPQTLILGAFNYFTLVLGAAPEDTWVPPCGAGTQKVQTWLEHCWSVAYDVPAPGENTFSVCPGDIACVATYHVCYDANLKKDVITGWSKAAGTLVHGCDPDPGWPWPANHCYDVDNTLCGPR